MTLDNITKIISGYRFTFTSEKELQDGIAEALIQERILYQREFSLDPASRPDFMLAGGIAIEVKIKGSQADLMRQVWRYAEHDKVTGILVIGTPRWISRFPFKVIYGKPVRSLRLLGSML